MATTTPPLKSREPIRVPQDSLRRTSFWAGVFYVITFVSIPTLILYGPAKEAGYIAGAGPDTGVLIGGVLELIVGLAGIGTAVRAASSGPAVLNRHILMRCQVLRFDSASPACRRASPRMMPRSSMAW